MSSGESDAVREAGVRVLALDFQPTADPLRLYGAAIGRAYHELSQAGGPLMPCPFEFGQVVDDSTYCDCAPIGMALARMLTDGS